MLIATDYEILRDVPVSGRHKTPLARKPLRVATLLDEKTFLSSGGALTHHHTVFFEDRVHDWDWVDGQFRYYTRIADDKADVVIIYATEERLFCHHCGKPMPVRDGSPQCPDGHEPLAPIGMSSVDAASRG